MMMGRGLKFNLVDDWSTMKVVGTCSIHGIDPVKNFEGRRYHACGTKFDEFEIYHDKPVTSLQRELKIRPGEIVYLMEVRRKR